MTKHTTRVVFHAVRDDEIAVLGDNATRNFGHAFRIAEASIAAAFRQNGALVHSTLIFDPDEFLMALFETVCQQAGLDLDRAAGELL